MTAANLAERDPPIKYHIPFEWGSFSVTEEADRELGLVPLTADIVKGKVDTKIQDPEMPHIAITLVGPAEMPSDFSGNYPNAAAGILATRAVYPDRIAITVGSTKSNEEIRQKVLTDFMESVDVDEDELAQTFTNEHGVPLTEVMHQEMPQFFVHALQEFMVEPVAQSVEEWTDKITDEKALKRITNIGGTALLTTGVLVGAEVLNRDSDLMMAFTAAGLIAASGVTTYQLREYFKIYLETRRSMSLVSRFAAHNMGVVVAASIHDTFCTQHFDSQERDWMGEEPDE